MPHKIIQAESADLTELFKQLLAFKQSIESETHQMLSKYDLSQTIQNNLLSLVNMLNYVAMRRHAVHDLQSRLARGGLSSLGRVEPHVMTNILSVLQVLAKATGQDEPIEQTRVPCIEYERGYELLQERALALFGEAPASRSEYIMVTLPTEAADHPELVEGLFEAGMNCARINCAHDQADIWQKMIQHIRHYRDTRHQDCRIMMDLAGHKIRTGQVWLIGHKSESKKTPRVQLHDWVIMSRETPEKATLHSLIVNSQFDAKIEVAFNCTYSDIFDKVEIGQPIWIDDGKIGTIVKQITDQGLLLQVAQVGPKGARIKPEKGINLPQTDLQLPTLSQKDHKDLDFVCQQADLVALSFTETPADLLYLQAQLAKRKRPDLPIIAKIETPRAVHNLPKILAGALSHNLSFGIMIARGDLAVELGSVQMAATQDAFIRLCESAHIPIIWATQVLESLAKKGVVSRPEISDAAMSQRAECVMLNKGPYITEAVRILSEVLRRMEQNQFKSHTHLEALEW